MHNALAVAGNAYQLTMSSREIATLTGKRHEHVTRDIRAVLDNSDLSDEGKTRAYQVTGESANCAFYFIQ